MRAASPEPMEGSAMAEGNPTQSKFGRPTRALGCFMPAPRWATIEAATVLFFGTPADALWAIGAWVSPSPPQ